MKKQMILSVMICAITLSCTAQSGNMVRIPGGTFTMGSPGSETGRFDDETQHQVTLSAFYMGKYEVTQAQWQAVMGTTIEQQQELQYKERPTDPTDPTDYGRGGDYPVYYVSWYDAIVFCNKLSIKEGLTPAYSIGGKTNPAEWGTVPTGSNATWNAVIIVANSNGYRLPTEAQWEYACRAGTTTRFWSGDDETTLAGKANVADLTLKDEEGMDLEEWVNIRDGHILTSPVESFRANPWGLYNMHGNVLEWCWDWYGAYANPAQAATDPVGASSGSGRVARGGCWGSLARRARSAYRDDYVPYYRESFIGFRVVRPAQ